MDVEVAQVVTKMKKRATETNEGTIVVINECLRNTSQACHGRLPNTGAMRKFIRRKRNEVHAAPSNPTTVEELVIPESYRVYTLQDGVEENFLLADDGEGLQRILIFGRESWLQHLQTSDVWYGDGTFAIAPSLFLQVYTVIATKYNGVHPIFYAMLPNKTRSTYTRMFELIRQIVPNLQPRAIHCDFEQAAFKAMEDCFPGVDINGCFFHLAQNMKKQVAAMGYTREYNADPQFALNCRMLTALAFVPIEHLDDAFAVLAEALPAEHQPLVDWFEDVLDV
uniref:Uncharacterized protein LOC114331989 n=1 Tax=Diabrotica virgifera virgifera TaxID=50390 RepID=A0A6P7FMX7_DIAVI